MFVIKQHGNFALHIPDILLPVKGTELKKWSVVACDQYTSQKEYWLQAEKLVGDEPSTLRLIFPEVYLEDDDKEDRIKKINQTMEEYLEQDVLTTLKQSFIYVDRQTSHAESRKGLMVAIDLEEYDYNKDSKSLIRPTEGTVLDRLPPRIKIREKAPIEVPHVMVLIDDPEKTVIEPLSEKLDKMEKLYDFDLMMDGGHIKGYRVTDEDLIKNIFTAIENLAKPEIQKAKYRDIGEDDNLLFAVGDGNHSLATAKACWENLKKSLPKEGLIGHPARFALVELVNVHDEGLEFEPIHRIVFDIEPDELVGKMIKYYDLCGASKKVFSSAEEMNEQIELMRKEKGCHVIPYITGGSYGAVVVQKPAHQLEVGTLQVFLDEYLKANSSIKIDYIHGEETVSKLGLEKDNIGFYLPPMDKKDLFKTVVLDGVLPRKTFSMGEAEEKRFYLECRRIIKD